MVAHDRPAFKCCATVARDDDERTYGRHLTVARRALVIWGMVKPWVYDGGS
jgi:hypothetical protein